MENDHLKIYFPKHKSDQIGLNKDKDRHVYSNPNDPSLSPLLALASYPLVYPSILLMGTRTITGIPPTSYDFGISPAYFKRTTENSKDIDDFASLVFLSNILY